MQWESTAQQTLNVKPSKWCLDVVLVNHIDPRRTSNGRWQIHVHAVLENSSGSQSNQRKTRASSLGMQVCPISSLVRNDMAAGEGWLPRRVFRPREARPRVPVWWNGSRVIEISCSSPSRYDIPGPLSPSLSLSSLRRICHGPVASVILSTKRYPDPFTCHVRGTRAAR